MQTLARTLHSWRDEIAGLWRFTKNQGITECFNRKMKLSKCVPTVLETFRTTASEWSLLAVNYTVPPPNQRPNLSFNLQPTPNTAVDVPCATEKWSLGDSNP